MLWSFLASIFIVNTYDDLRKPLTDRQREVNRHFAKCMVVFVLITLILGLLQTVAGAQSQTFKNSNGQIVGRSVTNNMGTVYRNSLGQNTGRSSTQNGTTTFYDASGRQVGRSNNAAPR